MPLFVEQAEDVNQKRPRVIRKDEGYQERKETPSYLIMAE